MLWLDAFVSVFAVIMLVCLGLRRWLCDVAAGCLQGVVMVRCLLVLWFVWVVCFVILAGLRCLITLYGWMDLLFICVC